ncbi:MAG: MBL fold metallo-hydrolase [Gemmatimonadota bacterium]|nr:MBL fold metallo-hydrolase [Gemmatimonadota bacterium]
MSTLAVTLIDVGWGDSILIEFTPDGGGGPLFALVDCNDTTISRSSFLFVKRHLEKRQVDFENIPRLFEFVLLTHGHADHANGIKAMMSEFGTRRFYYPKSVEFGGFASLLHYANASSKVEAHQAVDLERDVDDFGDVAIRFLWPPESDEAFDDDNENNNSVLLLLTLGQVSFLLTGDCEAENWPLIVPELPAVPTLAVIQSPHHGAENGVFHNGTTPWVDAIEALPHHPRVAMSSHIRPHNHPAPEVIAEFEGRGTPNFRTDLHYHLTFTTDGTVDAAGDPNLAVRYSRE